MFATMFIGVLDANSDEMFYVNCGHEPPPLIRHGEVKQFLRPSGLPIGTMQNTTYSCKKITFQKGDYLFLYTDGLIDAVDGGGDGSRVVSAVSVVDGVRETVGGRFTEGERMEWRDRVES